MMDMIDDYESEVDCDDDGDDGDEKMEDYESEVDCDDFQIFMIL